MIGLVNRQQHRLYFLANVHDVWAAWVEPATGRWVQQVWRLAWYRDKLLPWTLDARESAQQTLRVRMQWFCEDGLCISVLDDLASVHDSKLLTGLCDDREVVADEDHREIELIF